MERLGMRGGCWGTLDRYVVSQFFGAALTSIVFFSLTVVLIDLLMNLWKFLAEGAGARDVAMVCVLYLPKAVWYSVPLGSLFASSLTLSNFYSQNEMTASFASGVPLVRLTSSLIVISAACAPVLFVFDDAVVCPAYARKVALQRALLHEERTMDSDKPVVLCNGGRIIYRAQYYNDAQQVLNKAIFIFRDEEERCIAIIRADEAAWDKREKRWRLSSPVQYTFMPDGVVASSNADDALVKELNEEPKTFRRSDVSVEEVKASEAAAYIEHLVKAGLPYSESLSLYYKKYSFPCVLFIVALLAVGLTGRTRKNVSLVSLALSVSAAVMFYVMQMITMLMAKFGVLSPLAGAWSPVVVFTAIAIAAVATSRT